MGRRNEESDRVLVYDTTLRDGEQAPGFSMTPAEKLRVGRALEQLRVDFLEIGFPASSGDDFEASRRLAREIRQARVSVLARVRLKDIDLCLETLQHAEAGRIHIFMATSDLHIREKLRTDPESSIVAAREAIRYARNRHDDVQFGCEDATRADPDHLCRIAEACISAGATTLDIADTVGFATPSEIEALLSNLLNRVPNIDQATLAVHCHDDLGLAVANSLAGLAAGARQVECTINGIGERAGNAALEEVVTALRTRSDLFQLDVATRLERLRAVSELVAEVTSTPVPPNKAIVGDNAFRHEAGIHQQGVLRNPLTYEIVKPEAVGGERRLVLGKHSGGEALRDRLGALDILVPEASFGPFMAAFKRAARKGGVSDERIAQIARAFVREGPGTGARG